MILNPRSPVVLESYALLLHRLGKYEECYHQITKALEIDPLSPSAAALFGLAMTELGQFNDAKDYFLDLIEKNPKTTRFHFRLAHIYIRIGEFEKAIQTLHEQIKIMEGENISDEIAMLAYAYARWGKIDEAEELLKKLLTYSEQQYVSPTIFAVVYGALEDLNEAFKWLERAYEQRDDRLAYAYYFWYDPIQKDPRFAALLRKIGLE